MLEALTALLQSEGIGTLGVDVFRRQLPPKPDRALVAVEYAGLPGQRVHDQRLPVYEDARVQVTARALLTQDAERFARQAYAALFVDNTALEGVHLIKVEPLQPPFYNGQDANGRHMYTFNVMVWSASYAASA